MSVLICNNTAEIAGETAAFVAAPRERWLDEISESERLDHVIQHAAGILLHPPPGHRKASTLQLSVLLPDHV